MSDKNEHYNFHPSYGYATTSEIERLKGMGLSKERDDILKEIKKRTTKMKKGVKK